MKRYLLILVLIAAVFGTKAGGCANDGLGSNCPPGGVTGDYNGCASHWRCAN